MDANLLDDVYALLGRFIAYPCDEAKIAHALWVCHAHAMDAWSSTPRLAFLSPEPGSGKSRALEITELLVPRPLNAFSVTPAFLFRKVGDPEGRPTILYDEVDAVFGPKARDNEDLRALLNSGHRQHATVGRCEARGRDIVARQWSVYCAVAMAGLGSLPDTLLTRSVVIAMRRRLPGEQVTPFRLRDHEQEGHALRDRIALWAEQQMPRLTEFRPDLPPTIIDRDADCWEALIAIADAAGGTWPVRARAAAVRLVAASKQRKTSLGVQLLADTRRVFEDRVAMHTEDLLAALHALDESPWADLRGKGLNARALSKLLGQYGARPKTVRIGNDANQRGYTRDDLEDAWARYLPGPQKSATSATHGSKATDEAGGRVI